MKAIRITHLLLYALLATGVARSQTSGVLVIKSFLPGSTNLNDPTIDKTALARLDSLMHNERVEVTFLGAADSLRWKIHARTVHRNVSEALDDAKRLGRARVLRARYGRGTLGITDENFAGVKVLWRLQPKLELTDSEIRKLREENQKLNEKLQDVSSTIEQLNTEQKLRDVTEIVYEKRASVRWQLQAGMWRWQIANDYILAPSLSLSVSRGKMALVLRGGVAPWHQTTAFGKESESFLYVGLKYMRTEKYGVSAGGFRGWKFFTDSDTWSLKTTGAALGVIVNFAFVEVSPMITYTEVSTWQNQKQLLFGGVLAFNFNLN